MNKMSRKEQENLTARERIASDRVALNEIVVNAILFGLGLNLIADFLMGLPESLVNPFMIFFSIVGGLLTFGSYWLMLKQYLGDETRIKEEIRIGLFFDRNTGELIHFDYWYLPHEILRYYYSKNPEHFRVLISERISKGDTNAIEELFEIVLKYLFRDKDFFSRYPPPHYLAGFMGDLSNLGSKSVSFGQMKKKHTPERNRYVVDPQEGRGSIEYEVSRKELYYTSEYTPGKHVHLLDIRPYFKMSSILPEALIEGEEKPPSDIILFEFITEFAFTFSSFRLHAQGEKVTEAIEKSKEFTGMLLNSFDWINYSSGIRFGKGMMEYGKRIAFERGGFW